jgi:hypothetical protein
MGAAIARQQSVCRPAIAAPNAHAPLAGKTRLYVHTYTIENEKYMVLLNFDRKIIILYRWLFYGCVRNLLIES